MAEQSDDLHSLCAALGFIVLNWALAEQSLDFTVQTIYTEYAGNTLAKALPRPFQQKVDFLRKAFRTSIALHIYAAEGNRLLDRMEALATQRHDLVHGVVASIEPINGKFPFDKLDYQAQEHIMRRVEFDPKRFAVLADELLGVGKDLTLFARSLHERFG